MTDTDLETQKNHAQLAEQVADAAKVTKEQADIVLMAAIATIIGTVTSGQRVPFVGFGSFEPRHDKSAKVAIQNGGRRWGFPHLKFLCFPLGKWLRKRSLELIKRHFIQLGESVLTN